MKKQPTSDPAAHGAEREKGLWRRLTAAPRALRETATKRLGLSQTFGDEAGPLCGAVRKAETWIEGHASWPHAWRRAPARSARAWEPEVAATSKQPPQAERTPEGPQRLFDGTDENFRCWKLVGAGELERSDGELHLTAGEDCGLAYYTARRFGDMRLRLQYRPASRDAVTSAVVHFLDPEEPVPDRDDVSVLYYYENPAYVAPDTGFEVQLSSPQPGDDLGTFTGVLIGDAAGAQLHAETAEVNADEWNDLEVEIEGARHVVRLNGKQTARFVNPDAYRGKPASATPHAGFIGVGMRKGEVWLRNVEVEELTSRGAGASTTRARAEGAGAPYPRQEPGAADDLRDIVSIGASMRAKQLRVDEAACHTEQGTATVHRVGLPETGAEPGVTYRDILESVDIEGGPPRKL